jgi:hypothetical protein
MELVLKGEKHYETFHIVVFWVLTACSLVGGYQRFGEYTVSIFRVEVSMMKIRLVHTGRFARGRWLVTSTGGEPTQLRSLEAVNRKTYKTARCHNTEDSSYSLDGVRTFLHSICEYLPDNVELHPRRKHSSEDNSLNRSRRGDT